MHPALHEGFGNVCLEALAAARPVACLDIGGPASQITPETGFAASATNPVEAMAALANFLEKIDRDRALLAAMYPLPPAPMCKKTSRCARSTNGCGSFIPKRWNSTAPGWSEPALFYRVEAITAIGMANNL